MEKTLPEKLHTTGYDREEEYFYRLNRKILDEQHRARELGAQGKPWWHRCPSCGGAMQESAQGGLKGCVCGECGGVFFDHAELGHLVATSQPHSFKETLKHLLSEATKPRPSGIGQFPV